MAGEETMKEPKTPRREEDVMYGRSQSAKSRPALNREIQAKIGQQLRAVYDGVVQQGVPDRFVDLLQRFDQAEVGQNSQEAAPAPVDDEIKRDSPT
jgi:hypothetical protein